VHNLVIDSFEVNGFYFSMVQGEFIITPNTYFEGTGINELWFTSNNDQVYYVVGDSIYLLYDFEAEVGDTMHLRFPVEVDPQWFIDNPTASEYYEYIVVGNSTIEIDGQMLRRQEIIMPYENNENLVPVALGNYITEKFGFENFILPYIHDPGFHDFNISCHLSEYRDGFINYENEDLTCGVLNTYEEDRYGFSVFPNPVSEVLNLDVEELPNQLIITDINGKYISSIKNANQIAVDGLENGMYILTARWANGNQAIKFIKN